MREDNMYADMVEKLEDFCAAHDAARRQHWVCRDPEGFVLLINRLKDFSAAAQAVKEELDEMIDKCVEAFNDAENMED